MLIYDLLKMDHMMVANILDSIEKVTDPDRRKDMFRLARTELTMHSKAEEEVFYRPLRERSGQAELIGESFEDHHRIEHLLMELQATSATSANWIERVRELRGVIANHVQKEETDVFAQAQQVFSTAEAEDIAMQMMEEKGRLGMENPVAVMGKKLKELVE